MFSMEDKTILSVAAIIGIVVLEGIALAKGINGTALAGCCSLIAGIAGYVVAKVKE